MKRTITNTVIAVVAFFASFTAAYAAEHEIHKAIAVLMPTEGSHVSGVVTFEQTLDGMEVSAQVEELTPGKHGFHIHEFGDCSASDGKSAGGHFNPQGEKHAAPEMSHRHVGDLGNIEADKDGKAVYKHKDDVLTFIGENSIIGRSVIVHANPDDLTSQPTGDAGGRVACGVIGITK